MRNLTWEYSQTWWLDTLSQTYIQVHGDQHSHLSVKLCHYSRVNAPVIQAFFDSHALYLHFVLLVQAMRGLSFAYNRQLSVVRSIHVCNNQQCEPVFKFCRTSRLVNSMAVSSMRKRFVEQYCLITIVNITGGVEFECRKSTVSFHSSNSLACVADSFIQQIALLTMLHLLVH